MTLRYPHAFGCLALALVLALPAAAQSVTTLTASDGNTVTIDRDGFGVPHISAPTEAAAFFGQGFATAQDRLFQMETFARIATGRVAEALGPGEDVNENRVGDNVEQDQGIRTVFYTPEERAAQFEALSDGVQAMLEAYRDGINAYVDSTAAAPGTYLPFQYVAAASTPEAWTNDKTVALLQFFMRRFGGIGGDELDRLAELEAQGLEWFNANRPINDMTASTTITDQAAPVRTAGVYANHDFPAHVVAAARVAAERLRAERAAREALYARLGVPRSFGSFAAVLGASVAASGNATLLGAPQMGLPSPVPTERTLSSVTSEVELIVEGGIHIAGMTVPGIPGVIIGRTPDRAWTLTTGFTDNTDTFVETLNETGVQYAFDDGFRALEAVTSTIEVAGADAVEYTSFRTVHGPVYAIDAEAGTAFSWQYAFWQRELDMVEAFYDVWRADTFEAYEAAISEAPMSFNLFYADRAQTIAFWHIGRYPDRADGVDPRLPAQGDGTQEWDGFLDFETHPQETNPAKGYFVNWNNKPADSWDQGDNIPWAAPTPENPGPARPRLYDGVDFLDAYVRENAPVTFEELKGLFRVPRFNGTYTEYPGSYQQLIEFKPDGNVVAQNVVPPGQSAFISAAGVPSPHYADQWPLYLSTFERESGPVLMKDFAFQGETVVSNEDGAVASGFALGAAYPNPSEAGASLAVPFALDAPADVDLALYDALGRRVAVLARGPQPAGPQTVEAALDLPAGLYVVRLVADGQQRTRKLVVVR